MPGYSKSSWVSRRVTFPCRAYAKRSRDIEAKVGGQRSGNQKQKKPGPKTQD